jgi:hypothetical protein
VILNRCTQNLVSQQLEEPNANKRHNMKEICVF